ncbi:MAG: ATP-binding cassette domain-containing protein [Treponema sp.]|jgi:ABC-type transport system involved in Fe-S cluster assembly fused permease/ATPase subunit|nr:ATP-binding cassette domain-containing protein [Treponema sp.]
MDKKTNQNKTGMARLLELGACKKALIICSCTLSVVSVAVSFIPFIAIYFIIRELVAGFPDLATLNTAYMIKLGRYAAGRIDQYMVELKNVSFAYNNEDVIHNLSLSIPQNSITTFVGPSSGRKTTVSRLTARFWDVKSGSITMGNRNIREIDPEWIMQYISFVFQDVTLFNDTVINNIRIGKQDATDKEVYATAKAARCNEFISEIPQGYETIIGENGSTLSGGERQRISKNGLFARMYRIQQESLGWSAGKAGQNG